MLRFWGTPEQQSHFFPLLAQNKVASFCLSEAGSGSDAFALGTNAMLKKYFLHEVILIEYSELRIKRICLDHQSSSTLKIRW